MLRALKKILVVTRPNDAAATALGGEMAEFLAGLDVVSAVCEHRPGACDSFEAVLARPDLVLVLGGDGTFIGVARRMLALGVPFVGVNLGRVGFLTQLHRDLWKPWLQEAVVRGVPVLRRMVLRYDIVRRGGVVHSGLAVNDLVVGRGVLARLVRLSFAYDDIEVASFRADGLIVSTPTGSSAYGASAGGVLAHADLFAYCVTPVCPFLNSFKPMILPASGGCMVRVDDAAAEVTLTEDGQFSFSLEHGDEVRVERNPQDLLVADMGPRAYFDKLKSHGFLTER
jgi:NAD+ kinase